MPALAAEPAEICPGAFVVLLSDAARGQLHHFYGENAMLSMIGARRLSFLATTVLATGPFLPPAQAELGAWPAVVILPGNATRCDHVNLVANGSFERRSAGQPPSHIETISPGKSDLAGWEIIDPSPLPASGGKYVKELANVSDRAPAWTIDWLGPTRWKAAHGNHCLDLDGGIRQTINTEPGKTYELKFAFAANPELGPNTVHLRVLIDDDRHDFSCDSAGRDTSNLGWTTKSIAFKAARQETTLTLFNSQPSAQSIGVAIDHVVVTAPRHAPGRYRVTDTSQGPILLDTATRQSWRLTTQEGKSVWLRIPQEKDKGTAR